MFIYFYYMPNALYMELMQVFVKLLLFVLYTLLVSKMCEGG